MQGKIGLLQRIEPPLYYILWLVIFWSIVSAPIHAIGLTKPLLPDQVFTLEHRLNPAPPAIRIEWSVIDGYYLYKDQLKFQSLSPGLVLDTANIRYPASERKQDPDFGNVAVYRHRLVIDVPFTYQPPKNLTGTGSGTNIATNSALSAVPKIKVTYQGCADQGICYTPQHKIFKLDTLLDNTAQQPIQAALNTTNIPAIPAPSIKAGVSIETGIANTAPLQKKITGDNTDFIPLKPFTDKQVLAAPSAFIELNDTESPVRFSSTLTPNRKQLQIEGTIDPDYYLLRDSLRFQLLIPETVSLKTPQLSPGHQGSDEFFGPIEIYERRFQSLLAIDHIESPYLTLLIQYTVCSRLKATCDNKLQSELSVDVANLDVATVGAADDFSPPNTGFFSGDFYQTFFLFFIIGLGLAFTPCIFPMLPILSSLIIGDAQLSVRRAFLLSLTYVLFSAMAYALIGIAFGFFGQNLQTSLQNPIAISVLAGLFVLLALSMFGFFELQVPHALQHRLTHLSNRQRGGSLLGAAVMGFLSTLIVGPCLAPPLAAALTYIADSKDAFLGGMALFSMGLGLGIPLLIAGTSAGHWLPRAGEWMDTTKVLSGLVMLGMAIWMLDRIMPIEITMLLSGVLMLAAGIHMGALDKLLPESGGWDRFWKSIGFSLMLYGSLLLLGVATGSQNLFQPLKGLFNLNSPSHAALNSTLDYTLADKGNSNRTSNTRAVTFKPIKNNQDLQKNLKLASQTGRYVMLDFYADWCIDCKRMHRNVFTDPEVQQVLSTLIILKADVTRNDEEDRQLMQSLSVIGPPTLLFFNKTGDMIKTLTAIGYQDKDNFLALLGKLPSH